MSRTIMEMASLGETCREVQLVSRDEGVEEQELMRLIAQGLCVIPRSLTKPKDRPVGIGQGLRTKVNANIGTSKGMSSVEEELKKLEGAVSAGAHTVMDLSTGDDAQEVLEAVLDRSQVPVGTVPLYFAAVRCRLQGRKVVDMTVDEMFHAVELHGRMGVDFVTVHTGLTRNALHHLTSQGRVTNIVSRGGSILAAWMIHNDRENPFAEDFDRLLEIARRWDMTLSLGDGLRPGSGSDATDRAQVAELLELGRQVKMCREAKVQAMVEGPGHVPLGQIRTNVELQKRLCQGAPFYVLGPLVTDSAPGMDHLVGAIGGAVAASAGADFLCYVTPKEHLGFPSLEDVVEGVRASLVAAHVGDMEKGIPWALERDRIMSEARGAMDWEAQRKAALTPWAFQQDPHRSQEGCAMCGPLCAMRIAREAIASWKKV
ncbi:thiamine biosynthesis protein ThiC [Thermanaerovibrio velox DSM 12556]|uniref:Phosphomethylpyrimidine synthase n=1 Tax=Thermanaerovibrio velox DSM 12556 TaxID=926567 RepID=H0UPM0_9BACT|nr:phosphomethylpyrimidine synthase ThiC [Thermanaerovibrio velox]EHM09567.1 thiamine biosynthesis protein ThiC [Thermanaerovibrio velox DSM 12556]